MTWASIIIPLEHLPTKGPDWKAQYSCYPSKRLEAELTRIAGSGSVMLWWTEDEAIRALEYHSWAWCPHGPMDLEQNQYLTNRQTHMKIFFRDTKHAIMFKLYWI